MAKEDIMKSAVADDDNNILCICEEPNGWIESFVKQFILKVCKDKTLGAERMTSLSITRKYKSSTNANPKLKDVLKV